MNATLLRTLLLIVLLGSGLSAEAQAAFPEKPIKIVVYTGPGGLIDVTARMFSKIAAKYSDVNFVVENRPGAGGIVALKSVLQAPADGYSLFACTKSNIAKFVQVGGAEYVDALDWTAMLMADPECVITNRRQAINEWPDLLANAKKYPGEQNWLGPAAGGLDHVTALKIWDKAGIAAKWIPFKSGGKAIAALLGDQGVAYVGNPRDVLGNPDLKIAAVSAKQRLAAFPDAPTFAELGLEDLDDEIMWRGFALKKGVPAEVLAWYADLFRQVNNDAEWQAFWEKGGIEVAYVGGEAFRTIVDQDVEVFRYYLAEANILPTAREGLLVNLGQGRSLLTILAVMVVMVALLAYRIHRSRKRAMLGRVLVLGGFAIVAVAFLLQTYSFPASSSLGPAVVPRLWIAFLIPLIALLAFKTNRDYAQINDPGSRYAVVMTFAAGLVVYLLVMQLIGYFIATFLFVTGGMLFLGYERKFVGVIVAGTWVLFSYLVFYRILYVPLPTGSLFNGL